MCAKNKPLKPAVAASTSTPTSTRGRCVRSTSRNGCRDASCFMRANSGDSSSDRRRTKLSTPPSPPSTNARRHPSVATRSGRQPRAHREADAGRHRHAHRHAREHDAADERRAAAARFRRRRSARPGSSPPRQNPCTSRSNTISTLAAAPHARERRHQPHAERGARHDEDRDQEHAAAAVPIAEVAEHDAADRPGQVAGGEGGERRPSAKSAASDWERSRRRCPSRRCRK